MNKIKINIIQPKLLQAGFQCFFGILVVGVPQLRCNKYFFPRNATFFNCAAHFFLVAVDRSSIDVPVASFNGPQYGLFSVFASEFPSTQAEDRYLAATIQFYS